jgi:hypothetical protein
MGSKKTVEMPAYNKRFCEMAVEVVAQILVRGITDSDSPNCSAVEPPLRKAAGRCTQAAATVHQRKME